MKRKYQKIELAIQNLFLKGEKWNTDKFR